MTPVLLDGLGWATHITDALMDALSWAFGLFSTLITYLFNFLFTIIVQGAGLLFGAVLKSLLMYLLRFVDVFQDFFDIFAGTKPVKYQGNEMYLLDVFLTNDGVKRALLAVTFVGIAVCFIFTIYSVAKSMGSYALEHKRPISHIMKTALKSCIAFMIVPIMMYFGSQLSSAILVSTENAIIGATGSDETPKLSTILFLTGTFGDEEEPNASFTTGKRAAYFGGKDYNGVKKSIYNDADINSDFAMYPKLDFDNIRNIFQSQSDDMNISDKAVKEMRKKANSNHDFSLDELSSDAKRFPNLFENLYNYPLVYIVSIGMLLIMLCSMFVFIRKIIEVLILYVTSPLFVASMPLDGGNVFRKWREMFIGKLISGFGIVISMNLVMIFIPMIMSADFSFTDNIALDNTLKIVLITGCMYAAWKSNTTILEVINPEVAAADRASAMLVAGLVKMAANTAKDVGMAAVTGGGSLAAKGAATAAKGAASAANGAASAAKGAASAAGSGNAFTGGIGGGAGGLGGGKFGGGLGSGGAGGSGGSSGAGDSGDSGGSGGAGGASGSGGAGGSGGSGGTGGKAPENAKSGGGIKPGGESKSGMGEKLNKFNDAGNKISNISDALTSDSKKEDENIK